MAHRPGSHELPSARQGLRCASPAEGKTKTEVKRCLKRYIVREVFPLLIT